MEELEVEEQPPKHAPTHGGGSGDLQGDLRAESNNGAQSDVLELPAHAADCGPDVDSAHQPADMSETTAEEDIPSGTKGEHDAACVQEQGPAAEQLAADQDEAAPAAKAQGEGMDIDGNGEDEGGSTRGQSCEGDKAAFSSKENGQTHGHSQAAVVEPPMPPPPEEHESTTFECPEEDCGGKLVLNDDLCRFGHGLLVRCTGRRRHKFKWCNEQYSFIPAHEWPVHCSWCYQGAKAHVTCITAAQLQQFAARSHTVASESQGHNGTSEEHAGSKRKAEPENGKRRSTRSSLDDKDSLHRGIGHAEEGMDEDLNEEVRAVLRENRKAILCGDSTRSRHWGKQLREHRSRTQVLEMQARASLSGDKSDPVAGMFVSVMRGDLEKLTSLIEEGGDVNLSDRSDYTLLHWAAAAGSVDVGRLLLDAGAQANAKGAGGDRPLHVAASQGRVGFFNLLLARGADLDAHNEEGLSARHLLNLLAHGSPA